MPKPREIDMSYSHVIRTIVLKRQNGIDLEYGPLLTRILDNQIIIFLLFRSHPVFDAEYLSNERVARQAHAGHSCKVS
jgi:hypothetical protein